MKKFILGTIALVITQLSFAQAVFGPASPFVVGPSVYVAPANTGVPVFGPSTYQPPAETYVSPFVTGPSPAPVAAWGGSPTIEAPAATSGVPVFGPSSPFVVGPSVAVATAITSGVPVFGPASAVATVVASVSPFVVGPAAAPVAAWGGSPTTEVAEVIKSEEPVASTSAGVPVFGPSSPFVVGPSVAVAPVGTGVPVFGPASAAPVVVASASPFVTGPSPAPVAAWGGTSTKAASDNRTSNNTVFCGTGATANCGWLLKD